MADGSLATFRGPICGYASDAKQTYRDSVWEILSAHAAEAIRDDERLFALLLPSSNGTEIQTAINHGIPEHKIIAVDENPAIIAASKWRKQYPAVKFYGCKVSQLAPKLAHDKRVIAAANLDLCNNFSDELLDEFSSVKDFPRWGGMVFALTIAKGREGKALTWLLKKSGNDIPILDEPRMACVMSCFADLPCLTLLGQGKYINNRYPMAWAAFRADGSAGVDIESAANEIMDACSDAMEIDHDRCGLEWPQPDESIKVVVSRNKKLNADIAHYYKEMRRLNDAYRDAAQRLDEVKYSVCPLNESAIFPHVYSQCVWLKILEFGDTRRLLANVSTRPITRRSR